VKRWFALAAGTVAIAVALGWLVQSLRSGTSAVERSSSAARAGVAMRGHPKPAVETASARDGAPPRTRDRQRAVRAIAVEPAAHEAPVGSEADVATALPPGSTRLSAVPLERPLQVRGAARVATVPTEQAEPSPLVRLGQDGNARAIADRDFRSPMN